MLTAYQEDCSYAEPSKLIDLVGSSHNDSKEGIVERTK